MHTTNNNVDGAVNINFIEINLWISLNKLKYLIYS